MPASEKLHSFINRLPRGKTPSDLIEAQIGPADETDVRFWQRSIQPLIDAALPTRLDRRWNWEAMHNGRTPVALLARLAGQNPLTYCIRAMAEQHGSPKAVPVAMMFMVERYPSLVEPDCTTPFIVYISGAPDIFLRQRFGETLRLMLPVIDTAVTVSGVLGYRGCVGLHAHPKGGENLFSRYERVGLARISAANANLTLGRMTINRLANLLSDDGPYFYADDSIASEIRMSADHLRTTIGEQNG